MSMVQLLKVGENPLTVTEKTRPKRDTKLTGSGCMGNHFSSNSH